MIKAHFLFYVFCSLLVTATLGRADERSIQFSLDTQKHLGSRGIYGTSSKASIRGSYTKTFGKLDLGLSLAASDDAQSFDADGSYINLTFGDWVLGAGAVDRNWSYSPNTSLILSANARPIPTGYIRKNLSQSKSPLFSWVGPWGGEFFLGEDNGKNFLGTRLEFEPIPSLHLELVQTAQFTGGLGSVGSALIGNTNEGPDVSTNKMAGFGISYERKANRLYLQAIGEDEAGGLPSCWMHLVGFERSMDIGGKPTTLNLELVDTRIDYTENGFCGPNMAYSNWYHPYAKDGTVMGAPIDSEGRSITFNAQHQIGVSIFEWGVGQYLINSDSSTRHRLSTGLESGAITYFAWTRQFQELKLSGRITYQDFDLDKVGMNRGVSFNFMAERQF
jgi:hypothetical protein